MVGRELAPAGYRVCQVQQAFPLRGEGAEQSEADEEALADSTDSPSSVTALGRATFPLRGEGLRKIS